MQIDGHVYEDSAMLMDFSGQEGDASTKASTPLTYGLAGLHAGWLAYACHQ